MSRAALLLLTATACAHATGTSAWQEPSPRGSVAFVFNPTPDAGLLMNDPHARMYVPLPVAGLPVLTGTDCSCDAPFLKCGGRDDLNEVLVSWHVNSVADWPVASGPAGQCHYGDRTIPVSVRIADRATPQPWWRGDELVVPMFAHGMMATHHVWPPEGVDPTVHDAGPDAMVRCVEHEDRVIVEVVAFGIPIEPGPHPCASWEGREVKVRLSPYDR